MFSCCLGASLEKCGIGRKAVVDRSKTPSDHVLLSIKVVVAFQESTQMPGGKDKRTKRKEKRKKERKNIYMKERRTGPNPQATSRKKGN